LHKADIVTLNLPLENRTSCFANATFYHEGDVCVTHCE